MGVLNTKYEPATLFFFITPFKCYIVKGIAIFQLLTELFLSSLMEMITRVQVEAKLRVLLERGPHALGVEFAGSHLGELLRPTAPAGVDFAWDYDDE